MTVAELESKLTKLPQSAIIKIKIGPEIRDIKEIMYEEFQGEDVKEKETLTIIGW